MVSSRTEPDTVAVDPAGNPNSPKTILFPSKAREIPEIRSPENLLIFGLSKQRKGGREEARERERGWRQAVENPLPKQKGL